MSAALVNDGGPVVVPVDGDRIGAGPWARWIAGAVVPDESSSRAQAGRELAWSGGVSALSVEQGLVAAQVTDRSEATHRVTISAPPLPDRAWAEATRASRRRPPLVGGVEGTVQSIHLAHLLETDQQEPLVPPTRAITTACSCRETGRGVPCEHVAAAAFALADAVDSDPSLLLRWRGCAPAEPPASRSGDPWLAGSLPAPRPRRPLPPGAVVKRLGRSGIRVGSVDLSDALEPAYRAFAAADDPGRTRQADGSG